MTEKEEGKEISHEREGGVNEKTSQREETIQNFEAPRNGTARIA